MCFRAIGRLALRYPNRSEQVVDVDRLNLWDSERADCWIRISFRRWRPLVRCFSLQVDKFARMYVSAHSSKDGNTAAASIAFTF